MGSGVWLGHQLRPALAPLTLRAEPLSSTGHGAVTLGAVAVVILAVRAMRR
ncbi:MAG: hypothetical protein M3N33_07055 [Actinomycetota bacterium]|nr:hypothetical protein [Actinomycetota bacterium]